MPERNNFHQADLPNLRTLQSEIPNSPMARIRVAWPLISAALQAGHSLKAVHESLTEDGLKISYRTLTRCVHRLRLNEARTPGRVPTVVRGPRSSSLSREHQAVPVPSDPLAQAMEACAKPRYDITAAHCDGDPTKKKLI
jgi:hypothetical protein